MKFTSSWISHNSSRRLQIAAIILFSCTIAVGIGVLVVQHSILAGSIALASLLLPLVIMQPVRGLYLIYAMFFLVPFGTFRIEFPLFNSPLDIVATSTAAMAAIRATARRQSIPSSSVYLPLFVCVSVLGVYALIGHGHDATSIFLRFVQGLWPLILVLLLIETPSQAGYVLKVLVSSVTLLAIFWLTTMLTVGQERSVVRSINFQVFGGSIQLEYLTMTAVALVAPVVGSVAFWGWPEWHWPRGLAWISFLLILGFLLLSSYAAPLIGGILGTFSMILLGGIVTRKSKQSTKWIYVLGAVITVVGGVWLLLNLVPQVAHTFERFLNPWADLSGRSRLYVYQAGIRAFLASPWVGWGAYFSSNTPPGIPPLGSHSSFLVALSQYGLLFSIPFFITLWGLAQGYWRLLHTVSHSLDRALVIGMFSSFCAAFIVAWFNPVFGESAQDAVFWLFAGLMIVWTDWSNTRVEARLVL